MQAGYILLLCFVLLLACGAKTDLPCAEQEGILLYDCLDCQGVPATAAPPCEGTGLITTVPDKCIDDGGQTGADDVLEVYCDQGLARFCLSREACPWRDGQSTPDMVTCSASGLSSDYMARTIRGCTGWQGYDLYCCSPDGQIGLSTR